MLVESPRVMRSAASRFAMLIGEMLLLSLAPVSAVMSEQLVAREKFTLRRELCFAMIPWTSSCWSVRLLKPRFIAEGSTGASAESVRQEMGRGAEGGRRYGVSAMLGVCCCVEVEDIVALRP